MRKKFVTAALMVITFFLMATTIYIGKLLNEPTTSSVTTIKKTKAAALTYRRVLALNYLTPTITTELLLTPTSTPDFNPSPDDITLTPNPSVSPSLSLSPTIIVSPTQMGNPTPTEIILARANPSQTLYSTQSATTTITSAQKITGLPESGWIQYSLIMFAAATLIIFISFLY